MLHITLPLAAALMIAGPGVLAVAILHRLGTSPKLVLWGAATFLASQAVRLPLLKGLTELFGAGALPVPSPAHQAVVNVAILALSAGLFEEGARYLVYRTVIPEARIWRDAVTFGAGHGGLESVLIGVLMALGFLSMTALGADDPRAAAYWATPWYGPLLGFAERVFAICVHLALAATVQVAVVRRSPAWLVAAIGAHAAANAAGALALAAWGPVASEIVLAAVAALAVAVLVRLRSVLPP